MLAQNFKTPAELRIAVEEFDALFKVLGMLEREELKHVPVPNCGTDQTPIKRRNLAGFNMRHWAVETDCGTVCCIKGAAETITSSEWKSWTPNLSELFCPSMSMEFVRIEPSRAAMALRNFLTHGEPRWAEVIA